ncbi:patatin-like phospholipase family protein [Thiohalorhabdus sp.]|uniref:patatin-like phospholipase family protein n=1 Tax=Thiohalorhabdus sp. TaxID=3094134 RepID=UPI002FC3A124
MLANEPHNGSPPGITLALGGGGARGLAHAGVLRLLSEHGITVKGVVGTSIGAEIGAFYGAGLGSERIEAMAREIDWMATVKFFLPTLDSGGLTSGGNITAYLRSYLGEATFGDCRPPLRAIATNMQNGQEVVLSEGSLVDAVRASVALPGIISPHSIGGALLGDGGLVNPLAVDVAREVFGGPVVAVAVHPGAQEADEDGESEPFRDPLEEQESPALMENLRRAVQITQAQLVRYRLAASPPDLLLKPVVPNMGVLEFYRGNEAFEAGVREAQASLAQLRALASI